MNIKNLRVGVHVRVRELHSEPPPVRTEYLDNRKDSLGQTGVIIKALEPEQGGYLAWVRHNDGLEAIYWYSELEEFAPQKVPEDEDWDDSCQKGLPQPSWE